MEEVKIDGDPFYYFLPHHFTHTFDQLKLMLIGYISEEDSKPFTFTKLMRQIFEINALADARVISF